MSVDDKIDRVLELMSYPGGLGNYVDAADIREAIGELRADRDRWRTLAKKLQKKGGRRGGVVCECQREQGHFGEAIVVVRSCPLHGSGQ